MRIEEVEALEKGWREDWTKETQQFTIDLLEVLRAEAWYPIEKAEEMGVKDGTEIIAYGSYRGGRTDVMLVKFYAGHDDWIDARGLTAFPTHFKRIAPPEN